ncbi:MAG: DUF1624 domain-containing protein [Clostridia bacterium]|nr:DUF1624 domain-containing protein [Clostridia bacterium]
MSLRKDRIFELDFLRGLALTMMCLDHFAYDLVYAPLWFSDANTTAIYTMKEIGESIVFSDWRFALHYIFATLFFLLAGIGSALTKHHGKRILQIGSAALIITFATVVLDLLFRMKSTILFGVLSVMAVGAVLCWIASLFGEKRGKWIALGVGVLFVVIGFCLRWYEAPTLKYFGWEDFFSVAFGTLRYGADWFPIFPCAGVILIGYFLGKTLYQNKQSLFPALRGKKDYVFGPIGRKSLWIYLFHQPVLYGILWVVVRCLEK